MKHSTSLHVAVVGAGSFGRNHARVYHELGQSEAAAVKLAAVIDTDRTRAEQIAQEYGAATFASVDALLEARSSRDLRVDAASVAVPTSSHRAVGAALMDAGIDVLIEKPVAATVEEALHMEAVARRTARVAMVGHLERFNPAVLAAREMLTRPMFFECHRLSTFTPRSLDVDVVLDLMIHDLDVVLSMVRSPVAEVRAVGLPVLTPKVDIANVRVEFDNGCVANFTASRVSTERVRKLRLFQPHEYISIDYGRQDLIRIQVDAAMLSALAAGGAPGGLPDAGPGVEISKPTVTRGEPLRTEITSFLQAVRQRSQPAVTLEDGRLALALALEILRKIEEHRSSAGLR